MAGPGVVLITGAAGGIGAATARTFARQGWSVALGYASSEGQTRAVAVECSALGAETLLVQGDVGEDTDCKRIAGEVQERFGRIDVLVNNAARTAFASHSDLDALSADDFLGLYRNNVVSVYQMTRAVAAIMRAQGSGAVVNVGSRAGITGGGSSMAYAASKAALHTLTRSLARSLAPEIRVNCIAPGFVDSSWHYRQSEEKGQKAKAAYAGKAVLKRVADTGNIADAIYWAATSALAMTGEVISMDAGMHLA
jgi:3-oxoacyl-[acyl-carrier protein] reductase